MMVGVEPVSSTLFYTGQLQRCQSSMSCQRRLRLEQFAPVFPGNVRSV